MFTNIQGCTVYEKTVQNRSPTFVRHETGAAYWQESESQENGSDRKPENGVFIAVPVTSLNGYIPKVGDKITGELIADEQPPVTAMTVMTVKNFCFGSPAVQHLEVTAK